MAPITKILISALTLLAAAPALAAPIATQDLVVRQLAGVGSGADSIFTDTDNGVGYGVENAEDNTANTISSGKVSTGAQSQGGGGSGSGNPPPPPPPPPPHRRQLDKVANGASAVLDAGGANVVGDPVKTYGDSIDGAGTSGAANAGATVGSTEESTLENAGSDIP